MYKLGLSSEDLHDVKIEVDRNGRSHVRDRHVQLGYRGSTRVQAGRRYRVWEGTLAFDDATERDFLRTVARARYCYFQDNTPSGSGESTYVRWVNDPRPEYDEPTALSGRFVFRFEEVSSHE